MAEALSATWAGSSKIGMLDKIKRQAELLKWNLRGKPLPPPHSVKVAVVTQAVQNFGFRTFVETGTFLGDMVARARHLFEHVYTIEVDQQLHARAMARFEHDPGVCVLHGDSAHVLPAVLDRLTSPAVFWLDGHYSGGSTGKGDFETPVQTEVELILRHTVSGHAILIDDARLFNGTGDYPTLHDFRNQLENLNGDYRFAVAQDIIRYLPKT